MAEVKRSPGGMDEVLLVNNARYVAPYDEEDYMLGETEDLELVTVVILPADKRVTESWLRETVNAYAIEDDVFDEKFLAGVVFQGAEKDEVVILPEVTAYLTEIGNKWIRYTVASLLPGPYAQIRGRLRDVWKLEDDLNGTCMITLRPQTRMFASFESFQLKSSDERFLSFPLRSRLKSKVGTGSSIDGWRIVVKDNMHLSGVRTSLGNRAFWELYPSRLETAASIQKVIEKGVVLCGKTKLTSFGNWEEPLECIDYQAPWNPRADGYQSPGGSSSGSAAAVGSYDWLDIAIGTDSWGSITRPAMWCGCFGLRPSTGAASTHGIEPYISAWDMPGLLGRDISKVRTFAEEWLWEDAQVKDPAPFTTIIWLSDFWSTVDQDQNVFARDFVHDIEKHLGIAVEDVSLQEEWARSPPAEAVDQSLLDYTNPVGSSPLRWGKAHSSENLKIFIALEYDVYHSQDPFREGYMKKFNRRPYTCPVNERGWNIGKQVTREVRDEGFARITVYDRWFHERILAGHRYNPLIVHPQENLSPRYRDQPSTFPRPPQPGISTLAFGAALKLPSMTVPIAQIPYQSSITGNMEQLPFTVTLVSRTGTDLFLLKSIEEILRASGRPTTIRTGKVMF